MAYTFEQIQKKLTEKFPDSGFELVDFRGVDERVVIRCPIHGEQTVAKMSNLLRSPTGCPACGKVSAAAASKSRKLSEGLLISELRSLIKQQADPQAFQDAAWKHLSKDAPVGPTPETEALADRLVSERVRLNLTRQDVAHRLQVDVASLRSYETGLVPLPSDLLSKLASYGYNINYILTAAKSSVVLDAVRGQRLQGDGNNQAGGDITVNNYTN